MAIAVPRQVSHTQVHRVLTGLSAVSLLIGTRNLWNTAIERDVKLGIIITFVYAVVLAGAALGMILKSRAGRVAVDAVILAAGVAVFAIGWRFKHFGGDEGQLTAYAAKQLLAGKPIYDQDWAFLFAATGQGITKTMDGGGNITYGYPPLSAMLTSIVYHFHPTQAAETFVTSLALVLAVILIWILLPVIYKPVATITGLGFGLLTSAGQIGYPAMIALLFMVPVVAYFSRTGTNGRLGPWGLLQAICLGLACSCQQLPWFTVPFLFVGIFAFRVPKVGKLRALLLVARYAGIAGLVFFAVNAFFIFSNFKSWFDSMFLLLTQNAILHGQGIMGVSYYLTGNSGDLSGYSHASIFMIAALVVISFLFFRRVGPALLVLPFIAFWFSTRSQEGYYTLLMPLWFLAAGTVPFESFAKAWQPRFPKFFNAPLAVALSILLMLPAFYSTTQAIVSPAPLSVKVQQTELNSTHHAYIGLTVKVTNRLDGPITPNFAHRNAHSSSMFWVVVKGPRTLAAHQSAVYEIVPGTDGIQGISKQPQTRSHLVIVSDKPLTITTIDLPRPKPVPSASK
jgi:hypothetical protein